MVFYSFGSTRGTGEALAETDLSPNSNDSWDLSPDGSSIVLALSNDQRLQVLSLSGKRSFTVAIKGWTNLEGPRWAADGKGWFVSSWSEGSDILLFVDLKGQAQVLWRQPSFLPSTAGGTWGIPSPDGRYIALAASTLSGNAWLMENF